MARHGTLVRRNKNKWCALYVNTYQAGTHYVSQVWTMTSPKTGTHELRETVDDFNNHQFTLR